jgi:hypothetical protein
MRGDVRHADACVGKTFGYAIHPQGASNSAIAATQLTTPSANRTSNPNTLKTHSFRLRLNAFMIRLHLTDGAISPQAPRIQGAEKCHSAPELWRKMAVRPHHMNAA